MIKLSNGLKGLKISKLIVAIGVLVLILTGVVKWYIGSLIIVYLADLEIPNDHEKRNTNT